MTEAVAAGRSFRADPWLSDTLGQPVYSLAAAQAVNANDLRREMIGLAADAGVFFYAKVPTSDVAASLALQRAGFGVVDTAISFTWYGGNRTARGDIEVTPAHSTHAEAVARIAETCFV